MERKVPVRSANESNLRIEGRINWGTANEWQGNVFGPHWVSSGRPSWGDSIENRTTDGGPGRD